MPSIIQKFVLNEEVGWVGEAEEKVALGWVGEAEERVALDELGEVEKN